MHDPCGNESLGQFRANPLVTAKEQSKERRRVALRHDGGQIILIMPPHSLRPSLQTRARHRLDLDAGGMGRQASRNPLTAEAAHRINLAWIVIAAGQPHLSHRPKLIPRESGGHRRPLRPAIINIQAAAGRLNTTGTVPKGYSFHFVADMVHPGCVLRHAGGRAQNAGHFAGFSHVSGDVRCRKDIRRAAAQDADEQKENGYSQPCTAAPPLPEKSGRQKSRCRKNQQRPKGQGQKRGRVNTCCQHPQKEIHKSFRPRPDTARHSAALSLSRANFASPIPRTFFSSSREEKGPFCCRYSTMRFAITGPMPGRASNAFSSAALI